MRVQIPSCSLMSNGPRQDNVVPLLGGAVDLDKRKELLEPLSGYSFLLRIPEGRARLEHDKRLPAPQVIVKNDGIYLHWLVPSDQVDEANPPFIEPKFIDNSPF